MDLNDSFKSHHTALYSHQSKQTLLSKPGTLNGSVALLEHLEDCEVWLLDHTSSVVLDTCTGCRVRIGPVAGSFHLRNCQNCIVSVAARDVNVNNSKDVTLCLYSTNNPHIEHTTGLVVTLFNFAYPKQDDHFTKAGLSLKTNCWNRIEDHTPPVTGVNWEIQPQSEWEPCSYELPALGKPINPLKPQKGRVADMFRQQSPKALSEDPVPESEIPPINPVHLSMPKDQSYITDHTMVALTEPDRLEVIRVFYTREEEFLHEFGVPLAGIGTPQVLATLQKASVVAARFYEGMDLLQIGQFTALLVTLLLALVVVLLDLFVCQHPAGTAVELFLLILALVLIEVFLAIRLHSIRSQGDLEIQHLLEHETKALYLANGVEVKGDLRLLEVVIGSTQ